jgi:lipid-A-disaccharide synthase
MKYYIIAGEASGDLHASALMGALKKLDPGARFRCYGGDLMKAQGAELVKHFRDLAFMGFWEVITHLRIILSNIRFCKKDILRFSPDVLILVDYPGFNLRMASFAARKRIRVFYYISPQLWAWHSSRVEVIKKYVERMFVILPFEEKFYRDHGCTVDFVGHPLMDAVTGSRIYPSRDEFLVANGFTDNPIIALLPGSRRQEIRRMLRVMIRVIPRFPGYQFIVAMAPAIPEVFYLRIIEGDRLNLVSGQTYELLKHSEAALVTSGTATLETALMDIPQVVCYRASRISFLIARLLVHVKFISLVNLIMGKEVVKELIQHFLTPDNLTEELNKILDPGQRQRIRQEYSHLKTMLGGEGASGRAAALMIQYLSAKTVR